MWRFIPTPFSRKDTYWSVRVAMNESNPTIEGVQEVLSASEDGAVETSKESIPTQASAEAKKELTSAPHPEVPIQPEAHPAPEP